MRAEAERQQLNLRALAAGAAVAAVSGHGLGLVRWPDDDENGSAVLPLALDGAGGESAALLEIELLDDVAVDGEIGDDDDRFMSSASFRLAPAARRGPRVVGACALPLPAAALAPAGRLIELERVALVAPDGASPDAHRVGEIALRLHALPAKPPRDDLLFDETAAARKSRQLAVARGGGAASLHVYVEVRNRALSPPPFPHSLCRFFRAR